MKLLKNNKNTVFLELQQYLGKIVCVLMKRFLNDQNIFGVVEPQQNTVVVFPKENYKPGDFVDVKIKSCTSATLIGKAIKISNRI